MTGGRLLRTEPDGTKVIWKNHKVYRIAPATTPAGFYPGGSRKAAYEGHKDHRNTRWFAEAVRERRQQGFKAGVKPGPQSWNY